MFKFRLEWCSDNQDKNQMDILVMHMRYIHLKFYNSTNKIHDNRSSPLSVNTAQEPQSIAELFAKHFQVNP